MSRLFVAVLVVLAASAPSGAQARELTFEDRVSAQESIERVYYAHQIGTRKPFEAAVARGVLEAKVRRYLAQSVALETLWRTPITADALRRELERMASNTRMPERLRQLYAALNHDPVLIEECLVRPALVDRLVRSFFAQDERLHAEARLHVEELHDGLRAGRIDPRVAHPDRAVIDYVFSEPQLRASMGRDDHERGGAHDGPPVVDLPRDAWDRQRAKLLGVGEVPSVREERGRFVVPIPGLLTYA